MTDPLDTTPDDVIPEDPDPDRWEELPPSAPAVSPSATAPSPPPALRIVDERFVRERLLSFLERDDRDDARYPPIAGISCIKGTWLDRLEWGLYKPKDGEPVPRIVPSARNARLILTLDKRWADTLAFSELGDVHILTRTPPWADPTPGARKLKDSDFARVHEWLDAAWGLKLSKPVIFDAVTLAAESRRIHPVRDYLRSLRWDGRERLELWLVHAFGVADTPYARAVSKRWMISAVVRAMLPGCKADCCLVLEGDQGVKKSTAIETLATDEFFVAISSDLAGKDSKQDLRGKWLVELAELGALQRSQVETVKGWLSARFDTYRASYGRLSQDVKRHSVCVGTTNRRGAYLQDETGARRFWPVRCEHSGDVGWLAERRDQLWAEAVARFDRGEQWHLTDDEVVLASEEQDDRAEADDWQDAIVSYLVGKKEVRSSDLAAPCGHENLARWGPGESRRVARIMHRLGWEPVRLSFADGQKRGYRVIKGRQLSSEVASLGSPPPAALHDVYPD